MGDATMELPGPEVGVGDMWAEVIRDVESGAMLGISDELRDSLLTDMRERRELGIARYGHPVYVYNGRPKVVDLYQELLDAAVYARQLSAQVEHGAQIMIGSHALSGDDVFMLVENQIMSITILVKQILMASKRSDPPAGA